MRSMRLITAAGILIAAQAATAPQPAYYISPSGSDSNGDGSQGNPWASPAYAASEVRPLLPQMQQNLTVYLRGGTYFMNHTLELTPEDSGHNGYYVQWSGFPGEVAVLDAGVPVTGWAPLQSTTGVWWAPLPVLTRQVWVNGARMNESVAAAVNLTKSNSAVSDSGYITTDAALLALLASSPPEQSGADVEMLYTSAGAQWQEARARVQSMTVVPSGVIGNLTCPCVNATMVQPGFMLVRHKGYPETFPTALTNFLAVLQPGQGYVSTATGRIYYAPRAGDDMTQPGIAFAAGLDGPLVSVRGNRSAQPAIQPAHHITFSQLTFMRGTWLSPTTDGAYAPDQGGVGYAPSDLPPPLGGHGTHPVPATGLQLSTAWNISVSGCNFTQQGATALAVEDGSQSVIITRNTFTDVSCSALRLGQVDDVDLTDPTRMNAHLLVQDNYMFGVALEYRDCSILFGGFVVNTTVDHNTMLNSSWAGVTIGWLGWGGAPVRASLGGTRILSNRIDSVNLVTGDGGPIYVMAPQPWRADCADDDLSCRSEMAFNYVSNALHHAALLYHDEGSGFWLTHDNVVYQPPLTDPHSWWWSYIAAWASSEHNILMANNTAAGVSRADVYQGNNLVLVNSTLLPLNASWPPAAQAIVDAAGVRP